MIARKRNVRLIQSDNENNFLGEENDLKNAFQKMNNSRINQCLQELGANFINWQRHTPVIIHNDGASMMMETVSDINSYNSLSPFSYVI